MFWSSEKTRWIILRALALWTAWWSNHIRRFSFLEFSTMKTYHKSPNSWFDLQANLPVQKVKIPLFVHSFCQHPNNELITVFHVLIDQLFWPQAYVDKNLYFLTLPTIVFLVVPCESFALVNHEVMYTSPCGHSQLWVWIRSSSHSVCLESLSRILPYNVK